MSARVVLTVDRVVVEGMPGLDRLLFARLLAADLGARLAKAVPPGPAGAVARLDPAPVSFTAGSLNDLAAAVGGALHQAVTSWR